MRDSRRSKCINDDLTIEVEGEALYKGMAPERLENYVDNLLYMVHKK